MIKYLIVSVAGGFIFGMMDGLINANPFAQKLYQVFKPIAKASINVPAGIVIDLVYGFAMAAIFLMLYKCLPGTTGLTKGIGFAVLVWFFRVFMHSVSQWMMFTVPITALLYSLIAGLCEMLVLGILYGLTLKPQ
jgi:hypothetical protein